MKKFLSLVLALVMTASLVTISAGAKDFTDDSKITYKEAVDVISTIGVVDGYTDGNFQPTTALTRGAAAKIICNLVLGPTTAEALTADAAPFKDVPTDHVFAGYIAYCAQQGIINGYSDGTFRPAGTLNGYAFMKMLLGALGYDGSIENFTGPNWTINVAKLAKNLKLDDGNSKFVGSAAVTREEACLYAFNTLQATMVEYDNASTIVVGNVTVKGNATRKNVEQTGYKDIYEQDKNANDRTLQFGEKYFPDLKISDKTTDDLGYAATKWTWKNEKIGTYGDDADESITLTDTYKNVNSKDALQATLRDQDLTDNDDLKLADDVKVYVNGVATVWADKGEVKANTDDLANAFMNKDKGGTTVALFYNDDDKDVVDRVVVLNYSIDKIDDVSTKLTAAQKDDGATSKIQVNKAWYTNDKVASFDADTYVEDAYLLYIVKTGATKNEIIASQVAKEITGKVASTKSNNKATIDGTTYKYVAGLDIEVDDEGSFYLNVAGQIGATDAKSQSSDYIYIYAIDVDTKRNNDGVDATVVTAYYVTADGTKASAEVDSDDFDKLAEKLGVNLKNADDDNKKDLNKLESGKGVIAYSLNSDKELQVKNEKDTIAQKTLYIDKNNARGTDADTQFVFTYQDGNKIKTSTATGYKNVQVGTKDSDGKQTGWTVYTVTTDDKDKDIILVFVDGNTEDNQYTSSKKYAVVLDAAASVSKDSDSKKVYTYDVSIDGEDTTLTFEDEQTFQKGQVISYKMGATYAELDTKIDQSQAGESTKNYVTLGGMQYNLGEDEKVYTITVEYKKDAKVDVEKNFNPADHIADIDTITVNEGGSADKDDYVAYGLDGSDLDVLFVYDYIG